MEIDELIETIEKEMKGKKPWLRLISVSRSNNPLLYINEYEFKDSTEYELLHELAEYNILNEGSNQHLIRFCTNSNTIQALTNPKEYFDKMRDISQ